MKNSLEKNTWVKTDDTQWIKYMDISDNKEHWFKVVDCLIVPDENKPYCIFRAMTVLIESCNLNNGYYDRYIDGFYDSIEDISESGEVDLQLLAEIVAETDMFSSSADNCSDIFTFNLDGSSEDLTKEVFSHCDEVEEYIKKYL